MTTAWCRQTLQEAIEEHGVPEILNTDQGSQFTATEFTDWVTDEKRNIKLSMDGKGRAIDIFLWNAYGEVQNMNMCIYSRPMMDWNVTVACAIILNITIPRGGTKV
ncbi:MAG: hypothetical protein ABGW99_03255 [Zunongwangia sp.]|uniref:hypothetical protein n=1 Tax=Zunongwangia sp. TaxID=1965325 RepID=UPI003241C278